MRKAVKIGLAVAGAGAALGTWYYVYTHGDPAARLISPSNQYVEQATYAVGVAVRLSTVVPLFTSPVSIQAFINGAPDIVHIWDIGATGWTYVIDFGAATATGTFSMYTKVTFSDGSSGVSNVVVATVVQDPPMTVSFTANPPAGLPPLTVQFDSIVSGGTPPYSYTWYLGLDSNGFITRTTPSTVYTFKYSGSYGVSLWITDSLGQLRMASLQIDASCNLYSWQYGINSPQPSFFQQFYGVMARIRMPSVLPDLPCIIQVWPSISSYQYFYQTTVSSVPTATRKYPWVLSGGQIPIRGAPQTTRNSIALPVYGGNTYELGVKWDTTTNPYTVHLYVVDLTSNQYTDVALATDYGLPTSNANVTFESLDSRPEWLSKLAESFQIVQMNWFLSPSSSSQWDHGYVYWANGATGYYNVPPGMTMNYISPQNVRIGYQVGGSQLTGGTQLW